MHRPDLGVEAEPPPQVAPEVESVQEIRREQGRSGRAHGRRDRIELHPPHRPEDREREQDQPEVPHEVEDGEDVDGAEEDPVERDDREMRKVLVVEELRESLVHLGYPEVEDVFSTGQRVARVLDVERVLGVVVDVRDRHRHLG